MLKEEEHFDLFEVDKGRGMGKTHWAFICVVFLSCIFLDNNGVNGAEPDASEIISKVWWKYRKAEDEKERVKITLKYRDGKEIVNEDLLKVQRNMDIQISAEGRWRANRIEIENIHLGRTSILEIEDRQIDSRLSADIFTKGFLLMNRPAGIYQNM